MEVYSLNYLDYCKINRDKTFEQLPLNELDFAIFSEIAYFPFDNIVSGSSDYLKTPFNDVAEKLINRYLTNTNINRYLFMPHRVELLQTMIHSKRYQSIKFLAYKVYNDDETNFTAITLELNDYRRIIAFRGTTDSVIGWRENFNLTFTEHIGSQLMAAAYLDILIPDDQFTYYLTGHSKGANLAIYAASALEPLYFDRIEHIYVFDGPGFDNIDTYKESLDVLNNKISHYIPHFSIVGLLLNHYAIPIIIECDALGLMQHLTALWHTDTSSFTTVETVSAVSQLVEWTAKEWLSLTSLKTRERYFNQLFDLIQLAGLTSFLQLNDKPIEYAHAILKCYRELAVDDREFFKNQTQQIVEIGKSYYMKNEKAIALEHKQFSSLIRFFHFFNKPLPPFPTLSNRVKRLISHVEKYSKQEKS